MAIDESTLNEALAKLDALPRRMDLGEVSRLALQHSEDSMEIRRYRFAMNRRLRLLAREIVEDPSITDLEYNMIITRAGREAVRMLCELQLTDSE